MKVDCPFAENCAYAMRLEKQKDTPANPNPGDCEWLDGSHAGAICRRREEYPSRCSANRREFSDICRNRRKGEKDRRECKDRRGAPYYTVKEKSGKWMAAKVHAYPSHDRRKTVKDRRKKVGRRSND